MLKVIKDTSARFSDLMTPRKKLELIEEELGEIKDMVADVSDELFYEEHKG